MARALTSHQRGPGSNPGPGRPHKWVKIVVGSRLVSRVFLRVLRFSSLYKNRTSTDISFFFFFFWKTLNEGPLRGMFHCKFLSFYFITDFTLFVPYHKLHIVSIVLCNCIPSELHLGHCSTVFTCLYKYEVLRWISHWLFCGSAPEILLARSKGVQPLVKIIDFSLKFNIKSNLLFFCLFFFVGAIIKCFVLPCVSPEKGNCFTDSK